MLPPYHKLHPDGSLRLFFLPDLLPDVVSVINPISTGRSILWKYCLVCHEWNSLFTPLLYEAITLQDNHQASLLRHTLWHVQPARKNLIKEIHISCTKKQNQSVWMVFFTRFPNLRKFTMEWFEFDETYLHPMILRYIKLMPHFCQMQLHRECFPSKSISSVLRFLRRVQPTMFDGRMELEQVPESPHIYIASALMKWKIGRCEAQIIANVNSISALVPLNECLAILGNDLTRVHIMMGRVENRLPNLDFQHNTKLAYLHFDLGPASARRGKQPVNWFHILCSSLKTDSLEINFGTPVLDQEDATIIEESLLGLAASGRVIDLRVRFDALCLIQESLFPRLFEMGFCSKPNHKFSAPNIDDFIKRLGWYSVSERLGR